MFIQKAILKIILKLNVHCAWVRIKVGTAHNSQRLILGKKRLQIKAFATIAYVHIQLLTVIRNMGAIIAQVGIIVRFAISM